MIAPYPLAGTVAVVLALATLGAEVVLLAAPTRAGGVSDPTDPQYREVRDQAERTARVLRFEMGMAVLGVGSALAGWAALAASGRGPADRFLAGTAGVCFLPCVAVWLVLAAGCISGPWGADAGGPGLVIEYDD